MSEEEGDKQVSKQFINSIKNWVVIDDKMKKLKEELKILTNEKKEYEKVVLQELDKLDEKVIDITDGKLRKNVSKTQVPLKKDHIEKTLQEFTKDQLKTNEIIKQMLETRQYVERINLKRTGKKKPKDNKEK
jgi:hypothetical protein